MAVIDYDEIKKRDQRALARFKDAYARGLAEGRAQGLEEAAQIMCQRPVENDPLGKLLAAELRDRAAQIRAENGGRE